MKFIYSLSSLLVLAVVASSLVVHDRDSSAEVQKIHEVEREVVKREVTDEDISNVCPNCSIGFVCCPGINVSTCCEQDGLLRDSSLFLAMSPFAFKDRLRAGESLTTGQSITSTSGEYYLIMQADGNLVLYRRGYVASWHTFTWGSGPHTAILQYDRNFVLYEGSVAKWNSRTSGPQDPFAYIVVQNDGNLVLYNGAGQNIWSSVMDRRC